MTNRVAIFLAVLLACFFAADYQLYNWAMTTFTLQKLLGLIEYLAFWR